MNPHVTVELHENYVQIKVRFFRQTSISYTEHALFGASACKLLLEKNDIDTFKKEVENYEDEHRFIREPYMPLFRGHFSMEYELANVEDVTDFKILRSRYIKPTFGGKSVSGAFKDQNFKTKIFNNLMNSIIDKDIDKLNNVMVALNRIGG